MFGTTNILVLRNFCWHLPDFLLLVIFIAFATKVPTFPFYHWLTLAHVEASTVGSVILAALILKLGSYGFIRFLIPLYREHLAFYL
jgi:NADH-quinone oxidoreductase subunit M